MNRPPAILMALLAALAPAVAKKSPAPGAQPLPEGIRVERLPSGTRTDVMLPGQLVGLALPRRADGTRDVLALVAPTPASEAEKPPAAGTPPPSDQDDPRTAALTAPRRLIRVDLSGDGRLEVLREDLPADAGGLESFDVDGDGSEELLLFRAGKIELFRDAGGTRWSRGPETLVEDPALGSGGAEPRVLREPDATGDPWLPMVTVDGLRAYGRLPEGGFGLVSASPIPLFVRPTPDGLRIETPPVTRLRSGPDGAIRFGAGADDDSFRGTDRLRSVLLDPAVVPERRSVDCWSRLPSRERVYERFMGTLDGRPALMITTTPAEKLKIFEDKWLRVFLLEEDRTRAGRPPAFAVQTSANLWQEVRFAILDANGDGKQDLVLAYWKGIKNDTVALEAYVRKPDGTFDASARTTSLDVKDADRSVLEYGRDFDCDGAADLVVLAGGNLKVYPGTKAAGGGGLVASTPKWTLPLPAIVNGQGVLVVAVGSEGMSTSMRRVGLGSPRPIDLDGDGRPEILLIGSREDGRGALVIYRPLAPAPSGKN
jgi:hypothetical protein